MSKHKGFYSIIQYCPNPGRMECVNVGISLLVPDLQFFVVQLGETDERVLRFFPDTDIERLNTAKHAVVFRLREIPAVKGVLQDYVDSRANELRMTILRPITVDDPDETLQYLMRELVNDLCK